MGKITMKKWKPVVFILAIYFVMACLNLLFKKMLDEGKSHLVIVTYRLTTATIFLMPLAYFCEWYNCVNIFLEFLKFIEKMVLTQNCCCRRKGVNAKLTTSILCYLFLSALIGATITQYLFLLGIQCTSAAFATSFSNLTPVFTFLLALPTRQESVNLRSTGGKAKVLGSLICIGGVVVLIVYRGTPLNKAAYSEKSPHDASNNLSIIAEIGDKQRWILGSVFLVLSILCWSGWFLIQSKIGKIYPCRNYSIWIFKGKLQIFAVLSAGVFGSGLCYVGMSWCVEQKGPVFTSAFIPSIQIYIAILDLAFFHEQIYLGSVIGSILVICGLYILLWGKSFEASDSFTKPAEAVHCNGISATAIDIPHVTNSGCSS